MFRLVSLISSHPNKEHKHSNLRNYNFTYVYHLLGNELAGR
jgi:hypothetical protein